MNSQITAHELAKKFGYYLSSLGCVGDFLEGDSPEKPSVIGFSIASIEEDGSMSTHGFKSVEQIFTEFLAAFYQDGDKFKRLIEENVSKLRFEMNNPGMILEFDNGCPKAIKKDGRL